MICRVCKKVKFCIGHHLSYLPEVSIPVCPECHREIHHGSLFFLDPIQIRPYRLEWLDHDHLVNRKTGEIANVSDYHHEIEILMNSQYVSKQQMEDVERRIELGTPTKMPYLPVYEPPPKKKNT